MKYQLIAYRSNGINTVTGEGYDSKFEQGIYTSDKQLLSAIIRLLRTAKGEKEYTILVKEPIFDGSSLDINTLYLHCDTGIVKTSERVSGIFREARDIIETAERLVAEEKKDKESGKWVTDRKEELKKIIADYEAMGVTLNEGLKNG